MIRTRWWWLALAVMLTLVWWAQCPDPIPPDVLPPAVDSAFVAARARAQVLDSVIAAERARADSAAVMERERELRVAVLVREAATWERAAHRAADSARVLGDTLSLAWSAYQASERRADSLTVALVVTDSLYRAQLASTARWRLIADSTDAQRRELVRITQQLREAVDRANRRPPRDWSVGITAGGGCTVAVSGTDGACGPTIGVGVSRRIL